MAGAFNQEQWVHDHALALQKTQHQYLCIQTGISRDLLALHRKVCRNFPATPGSDRVPAMLASLTAHQQELQRMQEQFLAFQQKQSISAIGFSRDIMRPAALKVHAPMHAESLKQQTSASVPGLGKPEEGLERKSKTHVPLQPWLKPTEKKAASTRPSPLPVPFIRKTDGGVEDAFRADAGKVSVQPPRPVPHPEDQPIPGMLETKRPVRFRHRLESTLFRGLRNWAGNAQEAQVMRAGSALAALLYHGFRLRRQVVWSNLELAYPELRVARKRRIAKGCYRWASRFALDVLRMENWRGRMSERIKFRNPEVLEDAYKKGKGVLLVGAHLGNWEVLCPALSEKGYPTAMYVGEQTNPLTDELQNRTRRRCGIQTIGKGQQATMQIWDALRENRLVGMLIDQDERKSGVFVDFFGTAASTSRGAASFHLMNRSPVVLFGCPYVKRRVEIVFQPIDFQASGNQERDVRELTQRMVSGLELMIRRYPEQYFWMHRRWRTRPPGETDKTDSQHGILPP